MKSITDCSWSIPPSVFSRLNFDEFAIKHRFNDKLKLIQIINRHHQAEFRPVVLFKWSWRCIPVRFHWSVPTQFKLAPWKIPIDRPKGPKKQSAVSYQPPKLTAKSVKNLKIEKDLFHYCINYYCIILPK